MKTTVLTIVLILLASSLFAQQGIMFGINLNIENKTVQWSQEVTYFKDNAGVGFHFDIDKDVKVGFLFCALPTKIQEGKISPMLKFKKTFKGNEYFSLSGILKQNNFGTSFDYSVGIDCPNTFKIGLLYLNEFTE